MAPTESMTELWEAFDVALRTDVEYTISIAKDAANDRLRLACLDLDKLIEAGLI